MQSTLYAITFETTTGIHRPLGSIAFHAHGDNKCLFYSNMSVYNHRAMVSNPSSRIMEMLDAIRVEYDQLGQEAYMSKSQRDEFEHKSKLHCLGGGIG